MAVVCALAVSASVVRAQSALPTGWASRDVGSTGMTGGVAVSSGTWTVAGSGANIWGTSDEFRFAYRQITGDVDFSVRLDSLDDAQDWSKAGLMIRETLSGNSRNAFLTLIPDSGVFMQSRSTQGGGTARLTGRAGDAPVWLRLIRRGNQFTGYLSSNGTSWTTAGTVTNNMAAAAYVGLAVTSRADSAITTARFTNLRFTSGSGSGSGTTTLPAPWAGRDVGSPALAGSSSAAGGTFTVAGGGENIWGTSDQFHFVYQPLQGDVEVIARVASLQRADPWSKAGVMIRESLTDDSRNAFMMASGTEGWRFQRRIAAGDDTYRDDGPSGDAPGWARLVREGNLFTAYYSRDGQTWSLVGSDTISMASRVYVGVAVSSHRTTARATATFTNLTARTPTTGTNQPPTVSITSPASGATFTAPASITCDGHSERHRWHDYQGCFLPGHSAHRVGHHELLQRDRDWPGCRYVSIDGRGHRQRWGCAYFSAGQRDGQRVDQSAAHGVAHQPGGELDLHRPRDHHPRRDGQRRGRHRHPRRFLSRLDADRVGYEQEQPKPLYL